MQQTAWVDSGQVGLLSYTSLLPSILLTLLLGFPAAIPLALTPALTLLLYKLLHFSFLLRAPPHPSPAQASTLSAAHAFLRGAVARSLALAVLYPLVLAKVRVQAGATHVADAWARALRTEGVPGLYAGMGVMLLKGFLSEGVGMGVKKWYVSDRPDDWD